MQAQLIDGTICSTQFIALMLQEGCNECRQLTREQLVMVVMVSVSDQLQFCAL